MAPRQGHVSFSVRDEAYSYAKETDNNGSQPTTDDLKPSLAVSSGRENVSAWRFFMWFLLSVVAGFGMPLLRSLNLRVGDHLGSRHWSVCLHYTAAAVYTGLWSWLSPHKVSCRQSINNVRVFVRSEVINGVSLLAGLAGIVNHMLMVEAIGVTSVDGFYFSAVFGMMVGSLALDATGWLWTTRYGITWGSVIGAAVLVGGFAVNYGLRGYEHSSAAWHLGVMHVLSFIYGFITLLQAALSSQLGRIMGHFRNAATWNYCSGIVFGYILALCLQPRPRFHQLVFSDLIVLVLACFSVLYLVVGALAPRDVGFASVYGWVALGNFIGVYSFGPAEDAKQSVGLAVGALAACVGSFVLILSWHVHTQEEWQPSEPEGDPELAQLELDMDDIPKKHKSTDFSSGNFRA